MWRVVGAVAAGGLVWWFVGSMAVWVLVNSWPEYAALTRAPDEFTLSMQLTRLLVGILCSVGAGVTVGLIVKRRSWAPWVLSALLLAALIPMHVGLWTSFPVWYHLSFLLTLPPILITTGRLTAMATA